MCNIQLGVLKTTCIIIHVHMHTHVQELERLAEMYSTVMEKVPQLAAAMNQFDVPESVEEAERLMQDSLQKKEKLVQLISQACRGSIMLQFCLGGWETLIVGGGEGSHGAPQYWLLCLSCLVLSFYVRTLNS